MGDRFYLNLKCAYCGTESSVWYAPTCGSYDFKCQDVSGEDFLPIESKTGCGRTNFITASFEVKKAEDVTEEDVVQAFEMASNTFHSLSAIKKEAKSYLRFLKKQIKKEDLQNGQPNTSTRER